ncbi:MAG TPA: FHA domain-containing protein [Phototrophicaceae bacterium]|nr:FHA domain-containing protein [Phototrophicaceae bacterium]
MDDLQVDIMVMSGVEDGLVMSFATVNNDGTLSNGEWVITLGRRDDNDVCLRNDTFASRYHARLHYQDGNWSLEDCNSKNGTFVEDSDEDARVSGLIELEPDQLFRVGRTWMRIQPEGMIDA